MGNKNTRAEAFVYCLDDHNENTTLGQLFDYQNSLVVEMKFEPFIQLNTQSNINVQSSIEDLNGLRLQDYNIESENIKYKLGNFIDLLMQS